jgi:hypothetical protein
MKKLIYWIIVAFVVGTFSSCKDGDEVYQDFVVPNGLIYPQKADSLRFYSGINRAILEWLAPVDPQVKSAKVFWHNYTDSLDVAMPSDSKYVNTLIENLEEGPYTFYVVTYDDDGNKSIPVDVTGIVIGESYVLGFVNRPIASAVGNGENGQVNWSPALDMADLAYSEVRYKTNSGGTNTVRILPEELSVACPDIKRNELFEYRSVFIPKDCLDAFELEWETFAYPFLFKHPKAGWTVAANSTYFGWTDGGGGYPYLVVDNDLTTAWHSALNAQPPHCLVIDMQEQQSIFRLEITSRYPWLYGKTIQIYLSDTSITPGAYNASWGSPVAEGLFEGKVSWSAILPADTQGRYLVAYYPDSATPPYMNCAEVDIYNK